MYFVLMIKYSKNYIYIIIFQKILIFPSFGELKITLHAFHSVQCP